MSPTEAVRTPSESRAPRSRKARKAATRDSLKRAALSCFAEKGYAQTQIADIADRCAVAHGTFYVHFSSKEQLIEELLQQFNAGLVERLRPIWSPGRPLDLRRTVRQTARAFLDYWADHRDLVHAYAQRAAAGLSVESLRDGINPPVAQFLIGALKSVAPDSKADHPSLELTAHALLSMWLRIGMQALFNPSVTRREAEDTLVRLTLGSLQSWMNPKNR
ncbi:MAG: TetR/AcrR family transcriptional regulator [Nitrospirae bacterium]|nr:TetR/AcrR family transcriptional regulator [Nitrospirota bacterium]